MSMTAEKKPASKAASGRDVIVALKRRNPIWFYFAVAHVVVGAICLLLSFIDPRTLAGVSVWIKPFKFGVSISVYLATLAWFAPLMPPRYFSLKRGKVLTWMPILAGVFELGYIVFQASLGQASHFNLSSPFHIHMYQLMGVGAVLLVSASLWMGVTILRSHRLRDPYIFAVGISLVLAFVLGGGFGGYMSSQTSHWVGGLASDAHGLWLVNWVRDGGDLRVAHFFGLHAMQILPFGAWLIAHRTQRFTFSSIIAMICVFTVFTIFTFVQAIQGQAFIG